MKTAAVITAFGLVVVGFFWDVLIGPKLLIDANPAFFDPWHSQASEKDLENRTNQTDSFLEYYPTRVYLTESIRSGRIPLWNPNMFAGMPFLADPQATVAYPVTLLLVAADPARALGYDVAIHVFLAMVGMYLFLKALRLQTWGAVLGAASYAFSSFFYVQYGHPNLIASAAWIPFMFYGFEVALRRELLGTLLLTAFFAMGYLAGFPQVFLFGVLAVVVYGFAVAIASPSGARLRAVLKTARIMGISGSLSMLLASIQLIPFLEFYRNLMGLSYTFEHVRDVLLAPPLVLLRAVFPGFFGNPVGGTDWSEFIRDAVHPYNPEFAVYCGIGSLIVAVVALSLLRKSQRVRVLLAMLVLSTAVAVNQHVARIGYGLFPMFKASRASRVAVISCFALSALAAIGFSLVSGNGGRAVKKALIVAVVCVTGFALLFSIFFGAAGPSIIGEIAQKAKALPEDFWSKTQVYTRSGEIRDWARGNTAAWLGYERGVLARGTLVIFVTSAVILLVYLLRARKPRLGAAIGALFVLLVTCDIIHTARGYHISQAPGSAGLTPGVKALKEAIGSPGQWRMKTFQGAFGDKTAFPANANQIFGVHSLQGTRTINTKAFAEFRDAYVGSKRKPTDEDGTVQTLGTGISWLANTLDDLMSVRYVLAEPGQSLYAASSILRSIPGNGRSPDRPRMVKIGDQSRLALCQGVGETVRFKAIFLPVDLLYFSVGFDFEGETYGDSISFVLTCESTSGTVEYRKGFDLRADRGRWHDAKLAISSLKNSMVDITASVICARPSATGLTVAGWSDFEFASSECAVTRYGDGYKVGLAGPERSLSLRLVTNAREIPLDLHYDDGTKTRRWFLFPPSMQSQQVRIDFDKPVRDRLLIRSDSTLRIENCRAVPREWGIDPDCQLVYDKDMCIYENSRAIEKGLCLAKDEVPTHRSEGRDILALAHLDDPWSARCGECRMVSYKPEEVVLDVSSDRACFLVFQDMRYPGWKAYVDGREAAFVDTDIGIRAIELAGGKHGVVMAFRPRSFMVGVLFTCLGGILTLAYVAAFRWSTRGKARSTSDRATES